MDLDRINELGFEKSSKWKTMVLVVSFSMWWNLFIVIQCYIVSLLCTFEFGFSIYGRYSFDYIMYAVYFTDFFYLLEVIFTISYRRNAAYKKLRFSKGRHWFFILLDILSLIPFEMVYVFHYVVDDKTFTPRLYYIQNRLLRVYRIFQLEAFYGITVRKTSQYALFMFLQFTSKAFLISHVLCCIWTNMEHSVPCDPTEHNCWIWCETHMAILLILNWSGPRNMFTYPWERVVVVMALFSGFILITTHFYPYTLYVCMQLNSKKAMYYDKYRKLECFLRNMVPKEELKQKILHAFNDVWHKDKSESDMESLLKNIPLCMRKEIFTDVYWEAFRHSGLLRGISRSCKRSLSLVMHTESYQTGEMILRKQQTKVKMMFLVQGIIQIMSEENEDSPVLSFSSGTVFGELSLLLQCRSQAVVKCKSYCELQILKMRDAITVLSDYPEDTQIFTRNFRQRLDMAKFAQWRKIKFLEEQKLETLEVDTTNQKVEDCVKWVKTQWRATWEGHKRHLLYIRAIEEGFRLPAWRRQLRPDIKIEFVSNYLDLIVLSDIFEEKKDVVCLRTSFPWSIDPSTQFLKIWKVAIRIVAVWVAVAYPVCTSWLLRFPWWVYILSYVVTGMYIVDVVLQLLTAVKTKHLIITKFYSVLQLKLQELTFYLDLLAAVPYQLYIVRHVDVRLAKSYDVGVILHPAILKSHVFLRMEVPLGSQMDRMTLVKNCLILFFMIYLFSEFIQLIEVRDFLKANEKPWIEEIGKNQENHVTFQMYLASIVRAWAVAIGICDYTKYSDNDLLLLVLCLVRYVFFFFFCFFLGDFYSKHTMKIFSAETFEVMLNRIKKFLESIYVSPKIMRQLMKTLRFQWEYDLADHLSSKLPITKIIPGDIKKQIYRETTYKTLAACRMFKDESFDFIKDVMDRSSLVAVPAGSVLVTYGHTSHAVSIIHRGYCQLTSFLAKDITAGLGRSILIGPAQMFPMLSSFCNTPAPVSVITITDCEVIMINLEDLLTLTIKHKCLKDIVDVVKENNFIDIIKNIKPALVRLDMKGHNLKTNTKLYNFIYCALISRLICRSKAITLKIIKYWVFFYHFVMLLICALWPCCFGLFIYRSYFLFPLLSFLKCIFLFYMVVMFINPYYNKDGLLVTHPKKTAIHYLTTSFGMDLISMAPVYPVYLYFIADPYKVADSTVVSFSFAQNYIKALHLISVMNHLNFLISKRHLNRMIKIILILFFTMNVLTNLSMYFNGNWIFDGPYRTVGFQLKTFYGSEAWLLIKENSTLDFYMYVNYRLLCNFMAMDFTFQSRHGNKIYIALLQSILGAILILYLYAWMSSNSMFANIGGTIFQERITSLVKCLEFEKADDHLIDLAISHYNHEWSQTQGESLKKIFEHLPIHLHEELAYPLYRPTLARNEVFSEADEGFFKIMSMHVTNVYFNRGSIILFQNESQSDIYFLHKGKCFVYDWFLILDVGSIIGDIKQKGLMENKVYALTHVEMLKISSNDFYMILNNFYDLEANFIYTTRNAENFVKSKSSSADYQLRPVDSRDVLKAFGLQKRDLGFEDQSYFEDPENSSISLLKQWNARPKEKLRTMIIYPGTWKMNMFDGLYLFVTLTTLILIPTQISFGALTTFVIAAVGILDVLWLLYVIMRFRVGYIDKAKGDVVTDSKFIAKSYAMRWNGLALDILALIPYEIIPITIADSLEKANSAAVAWLRVPRLLRAVNLLNNLRKETRKLKSNNTVKYMKIVLYLILWFVVSVNSYLFVATEPSIASARNPYQLGTDQLWAIVLVFEYVLNSIASANLEVIPVTTISQVTFINVSIMFAPYVKGWLISQVLSILYVNGLATAYYKSQVLALELYLKDQETSPPIVKEVLSYKLNLLLFGRSENMPAFLEKSPTSLRIAIMKDLYLQHLTNFPLFQDLEPIFLHQLVGRMKREIYFPGQKIVEQADVDHQMFFIHFGEIYVLNQTRDRAYVEYVVGKLITGESFGEAQGLWFSIPHVHTYRARTQTEVVILHSDDWVDLRRNFSKEARRILDKAKSLRII